ncbi:chromatin remodelling complex Rsc7/Swp82 subunit-domain-containing protein [Radiomyces spectabilis]|uniref:chromatin remodelling complex Rsc7/Swp82 subunit-domain-containing protein n=1 Tax=Radiomyces spectabilis TaxID=64574 RepID=UPI00221E6184|nr:chromatin remodelling complex Rsc7/Swp82 subunit-domain-containing protein [Radiomyces spectabilis]KAI8366056.1 chromatin remodelling complex Rsc7/Swp82 subunit-domain-containing protein [Radiomyces spectabilis]
MPKGRPKKKTRAGSRDVENVELDDVEYFEEDSDRSFDEDDPYTNDDDAFTGRKRGRPKGHSHKDDKVKKMPLMSEVESDHDEYGDQKIDHCGNLLEGRQYRVPTFTLPDRDGMRFMFSKDPAALLGFRDSFVFLKKNPKLVKVYVTDSDKGFLVENGLLRSTFRTREVSVVTARSVFKQFGHRVVKKGRRGRDDYYYTGEVTEDDALDAQDPSEDESKEQHEKTTWSPFIISGRNNITSRRTTRLADPVTDMNFMYHVALNLRDFNAHLNDYRRDNSTFYDIHTNVYQIPASKQPLKTLYVPDDKKKKPPVSKAEDKPSASLETAQQATTAVSAPNDQDTVNHPSDKGIAASNSIPPKPMTATTDATVATTGFVPGNAPAGSTTAGMAMPPTNDVRKMMADNPAAAQQMYYQMAMGGGRPTGYMPSPMAQQFPQNQAGSKSYPYIPPQQ